MATVKTPKYAEDQTQGKGRRECPKCHKFIAGVYPVCVCGHTFVKGAKSPSAKKKTTKPTTVAETEKAEVKLLKVLKGRGFDVKITIDALDDSVPPVVNVEKKLEPIMDYVSSYTTNGKFELSLDQLLTVLKLPLRKD